MEESIEAVGRDLGRKLTALATAETRSAQLEVERDQLAAANAELTRGLSEKEGVQTVAETAAAKLTEFQDQIKTLQEAVLAKTQEIARVNEAATLTAVSLEKETEECGRLRHVIETSHASVSAETEQLRVALATKREELDNCVHDLEEARRDAVAVRAERDETAADLLSAEQQCRVYADQVLTNGSKASVMAAEVVRLQRLAALAEGNANTKADLVERLHGVVAEKETARDVAVGKLAFLQKFVDEREAQHKKMVARVIGRADTEITKYTGRVAALEAALEEVRGKTVEKPDMARQFEAVNDLALVLETSLGMSKSVPIAVCEADPTALQVDAVCARVKYTHQLVKLLSSKKQASSGTAAAAAAAVVKPRTPQRKPAEPAVAPSAGPDLHQQAAIEKATTVNSDAEVSAVDRLLSAVQKFYVAKNGSTMAEEAADRTPEPGAPQPIAAPAFSPLEHTDESSEDPAVLQPCRSLTNPEQEKLFQDWCRLKGKVRGVVKQLVAAKAAVAFLRYQEEQTKVYARNRDRLLQQLIAKLGGKRRAKHDLLKILSETSV
jgi:hypothetical protein